MAALLTCSRCGVSVRRRLRRCPIDGSPLLEADPDPRLGAPVGPRHTVTRRVGQTSTAVIYLGRRCTRGNVEAACSSDGEDVHIRVLFGEHAARPLSCLTFVRGARWSAPLRHPSILRVDEVGYERGVPYVITEAFAGRTLEAFISENGALEGPELEAVIAPLCDALSYVHDSSIVHSRLSPSTVLIDRRGTEVAVRLSGFREAVTMGSRGRPPGGVADSLAYMAPELIDGERVDARTDLYSLGAVLYYIGTGSPFDREMDRCPSRIAEVVATLTSARPEQRTPRAADVPSAIRQQ